MPSIEIEEFARILVRSVRDASIRSCDAATQPHAQSPLAKRLRLLNCPSAAIESITPDLVDEVVFSLLNAIDQGLLPLLFVREGGQPVDLTAEGHGELSGWYMGSGGWRAMFSEERFLDDFNDLGGV